MKSPFTFEHKAPNNVEKGKLYPAVFLFHGMGSNEQDLPQLLTEIKDDCHIFSLRGPVVQPPGYAFFTVEEFGKPNKIIFDKIVAHIRDFIEEVITEYPVDATKLFTMGFSQGGVLAQTIALVLGTEKLAGAVALSAYLPEHVRDEYYKHDTTNMPMLITHGTMDYVLPFQWGEASRDFFKEQGADVTFVSFEDGHGVTPAIQQEILRFFKKHF
ncbi:alpha/beta hydrolase [Kurthia massiliensis]|uniref:alpha/beta hydrolase n=1 Tax=Kurthia massiliensis TaxID=1033739 RepID=UPI000287F3C9|nr:dienelactone hydrolase family protein [Kurthia massiliensis]